MLFLNFNVVFTQAVDVLCGLNVGIADEDFIRTNVMNACALALKIQTLKVAENLVIHMLKTRAQDLSDDSLAYVSCKAEQVYLSLNTSVVLNRDIYDGLIDFLQTDVCTDKIDTKESDETSFDFLDEKNMDAVWKMYLAEEIRNKMRCDRVYCPIDALDFYWDNINMKFVI